MGVPPIVGHSSDTDGSVWTIFNCLPNCLLFCQRMYSIRNKWLREVCSIWVFLRCLCSLFSWGRIWWYFCQCWYTETAEQRQTCLKQWPCSRGNWPLHTPFLNQPPVRSKLTKFYTLATVQFKKYCTCAERFPNLNVVTVSDGVTEFTCCYNDKHIPKLYSVANNVNPGPLSAHLQVRGVVLFDLCTGTIQLCTF